MLFHAIQLQCVKFCYQIIQSKNILRCLGMETNLSVIRIHGIFLSYGYRYLFHVGTSKLIVCIHLKVMAEMNYRDVVSSNHLWDNKICIVYLRETNMVIDVANLSSHTILHNMFFCISWYVSKNEVKSTKWLLLCIYIYGANLFLLWP